MDYAPPPGIDLSANKGPTIIAVVSVLAGLAIASSIARLTARRLKHVDLNASDWTILAGTVLMIGITVCLIIEAALGEGKHVYVVPLNQLIALSKTSYAGAILYSFTLPCIKISILLLYRALFPGRGFSIVTYLIGSLVVMWGIVVFIFAVYPCNPIKGFWNFYIPSKCINPKTFYIATTFPNIFTDIAILCLPIYKVWDLQMPLKQKMFVVVMFLTGSLACIASIVRLVFVYQFDEADVTWTSEGLGLWSSIEISIGVISANLPTLRPIISLAIPKSWAGSKGISDKTGTSHHKGTTHHSSSSGSMRSEKDRNKLLSVQERMYRPDNDLSYLESNAGRASVDTGSERFEMDSGTIRVDRDFSMGSEH
ncbi:hypothetical protein MMC25_000636 [Agyrium rufum]|nr:hypothetical protein [Agyrium rufum]